VSRGPIAATVALLAAGAAVLAVRSTDPADAGGGSAPAVGSVTGKWLALAPATLERTEVAAARIGRSIYVVGGFEKSTGKSTGALERYDIREDRWSRLRSMPIGVNHPAAAELGGKLYLHGGYRARGALSSTSRRLYVYSPSSNRWRRLPDARTARGAHVFAALDGRLYAAGGRGEGGELRSMEIYDPTRRRWRAGPPLKGPPRDHMTGVAAGGYLYALAGRDPTGPGNYRTAERYDPRRRRWRLLPEMSKARGGIAAAAVSGGGSRVRCSPETGTSGARRNNVPAARLPRRSGCAPSHRVVVFGGEEPAGTIAEVEIYDPKRRRWRSLPDMRTPRHGLGGASLGDRVYALEGGPQPGFFFADTLEYLDVR